MQSVPQQIFLNLIIKGWISQKTGWLVYFNEPALELVVKHDIHANNLEAKTVLYIQRFGRLVDMCHMMNTNHQCLHANVFNFLPYIFTTLVNSKFGIPVYVL